MARQKQVYSTSGEVAHLWANKVQEHARCRNTSFYLSDDRYISYSTTIAQRFNRDGEELILLSANDYSATTSKHKRELRLALRPAVVIEVPVVHPILRDHDRNQRYFLDKAADNMVKASRARKESNRDYYASLALDLVQQMEHYSNFFDLKWEIPSDLAALGQEHEKLIAARREQIRKANEARRAEEAERLKLWVAGEVDGWFTETKLRVRGDQIQTTHGALIPTEHAIRVWPLLKRMKLRGEVYRHSDYSINLGHYRVTSFDGDTLVVGCHDIPWPELERMAIVLELEDGPVTLPTIVTQFQEGARV